MRKPSLKFILVLNLIILIGCIPENYPPGVTFQSVPHNFVSIDWSPDSQNLVGTTMPLPHDGINIGHPPSEVFIWQKGSDSFEQVSDAAFTRWNDHALWHPNGQQVMYYSQSEFGEDYNFGLVDLTTRDRGPLLEHGIYADWFPDGRRIAVVSFGIHVVDTTNSEVLMRWPSPWGQLVHTVAVSPDGLTIALSTGEVGEYTNRIFLLSDDGKTDTLIREVDGSMRELDWSPDGQWLTFWDSASSGDVVAIRVADNCQTVPLGLEAIVQSDVSIRNIKWSPDGELIAINTRMGRKYGIFYIETASTIIQDWLATASCE